eukprot:1137748-Pelagomonas_calceolata.AAC.3
MVSPSLNTLLALRRVAHRTRLALTHIDHLIGVQACCLFSWLVHGRIALHPALYLLVSRPDADLTWFVYRRVGDGQGCNICAAPPGASRGSSPPSWVPIRFAGTIRRHTAACATTADTAAAAVVPVLAAPPAKSAVAVIQPPPSIHT